MRLLFSILILFSGINLFAQNNSLKGELLDETANPLPSGTIVLLEPSDSTLIYFGISGRDGRFEIMNVKRGNYLLQASFIGYTTLYRNIQIPLENGKELGTLILFPKPVSLNEVKVVADRIPLQIRNDTIEYNAKAFKVKSDAIAEDLIKKLPGVEVDRAGNIKAMGEDVKNVLVDGKEFFGNDPKVATKNLPANAINKVQLYDRPSDESQFTGIDDGTRNQTLNLIMDDDKKIGVFGDVMAGAGSGEYYQANARLYRFTDKFQLAALGMYNNVNQFGFSLSDYISFSGGMAAMSSGSHKMMIGGESSFPVNFGQPVYGEGSNGAAGINFSINKSQNNRFFISYLGNGSRSNLIEASKSRNYTPAGTFQKEQSTNQIKRDTSHRVNFGLRKLIGEKQNIILNGGFTYNSTFVPIISSSESFSELALVNSLSSVSSDLTSRVSGNLDGAYLLKINEGKTIYKVSGRASFTGSDSETIFDNRVEYFNPIRVENINQFQTIKSDNLAYSATTSVTQKVSSKSFIDFVLSAGVGRDDYNRKQGHVSALPLSIDSLSPNFVKEELWFRPGLNLKVSAAKYQFSVGLQANAGSYTTFLDDDGGSEDEYFSLLPRFNWEYNYKSGRRFMADFSTRMNTPAANQLLPVVNNFNSISLFYGNRNLKPEFVKSARIMWWLFDQFSFTTLLTSLNATHTTNKINFNRSIDTDLRQIVTLINVREDWTASANIDFSTPIKPLGIMVNLAVNESYSHGLNMINSIENTNDILGHKVSLTLSNRKKDKWDIETGTALSVTQTKFSVQESLDDVYNDISWFAEASYTPNVHFNFKTSADITSYSASSTDQSQLIPLIGAELSYYFLKNQRGVLTVAGIDLLNRNTGVERRSDTFSYTERTTNMIGRYIMFSFKYRLNKLGDPKSGVDIKIKR